jgi:hypothetical protein
MSSPAFRIGTGDKDFDSITNRAGTTVSFQVEERLPTNEYEPEPLFPQLMIFFVLGSALPAAFGLYGMYLDSAYRASLPDTANFGRCGLHSLYLFVMTFVIAPVCGLFTAGLSLGLRVIAFAWR